MTDPLNSSKIIEVQMVTLKVHPQIACVYNIIKHLGCIFFV